MNSSQELPLLSPTRLEETSAGVKLPVLVENHRLNLLKWKWLRTLLVSRWPQFAVRVLTLSGFTFVILAGLFGSPVGSHNIAIIFVWIAWWTALKLVFIPLGGRSWCSICPIPMPGEWLQRGFSPAFTKDSPRRGLNKRWPRWLKGTWLQSGSFLLIGLFSAVTLTDPRVTAWVLAGLILLAVLLSLTFENRAFCSYVCPIGGFTGLFAQAMPVEVRVNDTSICSTHIEKSCYTACPWGIYPVALKNSAACGLCMECIRACPKDNLAVNLRPYSSDLGQSGSASRLDEAFIALVMLGSALAFSAVFTGPWGSLKSAAFQIGSQAWWSYAGGLLALNLLLLPGLFGLAVWTGECLVGNKLSAGTKDLRQSVANQAQLLLPVGLLAWIAFTISFAFPKANYVLSVLSDPLGWGWNLFGTANLNWTPQVANFSPALQGGLLLLGLFWTTRIARSLAAGSKTSSFRSYLPVLGFCLAFSIAMLWLLI